MDKGDFINVSSIKTTSSMPDTYDSGHEPFALNSSSQNHYKRVVLVNGVPASGKSRITEQLSNLTGWLQLSLDGIKNPFLQRIPNVTREFNRVLGLASYQTMWSIVEGAPVQSTFILDAWFGFQPKEVLQQYLFSSGVTHLVEVWCEIPGELAAARYESRLSQRLPGHPGEEYIPELIALASRAVPMQISPVYKVDQTQHHEIEPLYQWILDSWGFPDMKK
ncbi:AAA family ATPase [Enterobacter sp. CP102]|nr:AAA family ATPase [Enterobacter sp. CP102]UWM63500.1 AAA family ATPase [Enterobacter sp. CP102]